MNRSSNVWSACFLALVMIAIAIPVAGQSQPPGTPSGPSQAQLLKLMQAEQLVAKEEATLGRTYDSSFRSKLLSGLASKSSDELYALGNSGGNIGADAVGLGDSGDNLVFFPVPPCRIIDTRVVGGPIPAGGTRNFLAAGGPFNGQGGSPTSCGIPFGPATAVVINFVAVSPAGIGDFRVFPFPQAAPLASAINFVPGANVANGFPQPICNPALVGCGADITVLADSSASQLVADVLGYFAAPSSPVTQNLYAAVTAPGALVAGQSFRATTAFSLGSNFYEVEFNRNITNCNAVAGIGDPGVGGSTPGFVTTTGRSGNPNGLFIGTYNAAGAATTRNFFVHVMCPPGPSTP
jgi:hypothetical protein